MGATTLKEGLTTAHWRIAHAIRPSLWPVYYVVAHGHRKRPHISAGTRSLKSSIYRYPHSHSQVSLCPLDIITEPFHGDHSCGRALLWMREHAVVWRHRYDKIWTLRPVYITIEWRRTKSDSGALRIDTITKSSCDKVARASNTHM